MRILTPIRPLAPILAALGLAGCIAAKPPLSLERMTEFGARYRERVITDAALTPIVQEVANARLGRDGPEVRVRIEARAWSPNQGGTGEPSQEDAMKTSIVLAAAMLIVLVSPSFAQVAASGLVGSYIVTGTEANGAPYDSPGTLNISMAVSGALEFSWDGGKYVGVGQIVGNTVAVASAAEGRAVIGIMNVNPDCSLSGKWWRRTDAGAMGTEVWRKR